MIPPAESFTVPDITVCGVTYAVGATFATQADFLSLLNDSLAPAFGLLGTFTIVSDELFYTTSEECSGTNCVSVEDPTARLMENGDRRIAEDGTLRIME